MNTQPNTSLSHFISITPGDEMPFQNWQDVHPNQVRIKLNQSDLKDLLDVGFDASLGGQSLINQFVLREYFTCDVFDQLIEFRKVGSCTNKYVYFRISTALALFSWLSGIKDTQNYLDIVAKLRQALAKQKLIKL